MDHPGRRGRLAARLDELRADAFLVTRLPNVRYLSGFTGSNGQLLVTRDAVAFITDTRYGEQVAHEVPDVEARVYPRDFVSTLAELCRERGVRRLAFEANGLTFQTYRRLAGIESVELTPAEEEVERLRWTKEPEELDLIGRAQELTDEGFERVTAKLVEGITERQVAWELEQTMREAGADGIAFEAIVAFGEMAAEPHHRPTDRTLKRGDVVKLDFGCTVGGYHSDMTRTVAFGKPAPELREMHELVARAQAAGIEAARVGAVGGAADEAARSVIADAGYGTRFGHSLGHGVGLEVHEGPTLRKDSPDVLPDNAVVTVEPGVYVPGLGGVRIEDMIVVTSDGPRPMPSAPREMLVL